MDSQRESNESFIEALIMTINDAKKVLSTIENHFQNDQRRHRCNFPNTLGFECCIIVLRPLVLVQILCRTDLRKEWLWTTLSSKDLTETRKKRINHITMIIFWRLRDTPKNCIFQYIPSHGLKSEYCNFCNFRLFRFSNCKMLVYFFFI